MKITRYITVDLVIQTNFRCEALVRAFEDDDTFVGQSDIDGEDRRHLNISALPQDNAELCLGELCRRIEAFPVEATEEWHRADFKEFFLGYEVGEKPSCFQEHLGSEVIARVARLQVGLGIAMYPASDEKDQ